MTQKDFKELLTGTIGSPYSPWKILQWVVVHKNIDKMLPTSWGTSVPHRWGLWPTEADTKTKLLTCCFCCLPPLLLFFFFLLLHPPPPPVINLPLNYTPSPGDRTCRKAVSDLPMELLSIYYSRLDIPCPNWVDYYSKVYPSLSLTQGIKTPVTEWHCQEQNHVSL